MLSDKIELSKSQERFAFSDAVVVVIYSNTGEGKTYAGVIAMLIHASRCGRPINCAIVRDTHENIKLSPVRTIQRALDGINPPAKDGTQNLYTFKNDYKQLTIHTHPAIMVDLFGIDDPASLSRLQGPEYDLIWLEEPAPMVSKVNAGLSEDVFNAALVRATRGTAGKFNRLQITMNPAEDTHWTFRRLIDCDQIDPDNPLITKEVIRIPYGENRFVSEVSRQGVKAAYKDDPDSYKRYVGGEFTEVYGGIKVSPDYVGDIHRSKDFLYPLDGLQGFRGWDGWTNPSCYDIKTKILTNNGWKHYSNFDKKSDLVLTLNPDTRIIEYQEATGVIVKLFTGQMCHWNNKNYDVRVTFDHDMCHDQKGKIDFVKAYAYEEYVLPGSGIWPGNIKKGMSDILGDVSPVDFCAFYFIFMKYGFLSSFEVGINSKVTALFDKQKDSIDDFLSRVGDSHWDGLCWWVRVSDTMFDFLRRSRATSDFMPSWLEDMPGDAIGAGLYFSNKFSEANESRPHLEGRSTGLTMKSSRRKGAELRGDFLSTQEVSEEKVWCISVPNRIIAVQRNGPPVWNGNCILGQIAHNGRLTFLDSVRISNSDVGVLINSKVNPLLQSPRWKGKCNGWRDIGDVSMKTPDQSNREESASRVVEAELDTYFECGPKHWTYLKKAVIRALNMSIQGKPAICLSSREKLLHAALRGGWQYKTDHSGNIVSGIPDKNEHSHIGDCFANLVSVLLPGTNLRSAKREQLRKMSARGRKRAASYSQGGSQRKITL